MSTTTASSADVLHEPADVLGEEPAAPRSFEAPEDRFLNRELSWLEFNRRVLHEAQDPSVPLLERVKFVAIFGSNLDEFFMKRVGGLKEQLATDLRRLTPDGRTPGEQLAEIDAVVRPLVERQREIFHQELLPALLDHGVELVPWDEVRPAEASFLAGYFESNVFPILTPLAVDPAHPFPFISNLSLSLAVSVRHPESGDRFFARVKVPASVPRWVALPESHRFVALEEVIAHNLERLFPGMEVVDCHPFRVTRNADVQRNEETADDLLESIQEELRERRFATCVRLELTPGTPGWMRDFLCRQLGVGEDDLYEIDGPLALRDLMQWAGLPFDELKEEPWTPVTHPRLHKVDDELDIFQVVSNGDILVHHPYDSFVTSVQRFIETAAADSRVLAMKQTLYRTSSQSRIMRALVKAAESRKQVAVSVEIKARFDEAQNIEWAEALEKAGAHVAYGMVGLKTHAKLALVVREEAGQVKSYAHIATGNYNSDTASLYTDLGLFTANPQIAREVVQVFNLLTGYVHHPDFDKLLVAPINMKQRFLGLIDREIEHQRAGRRGRIVVKVNGLEDVDMVEALYRASQAGVEIDLVVRGICRLRPGVPGLSPTIRVLSIVGRFLEHPRIFYFGNGDAPEVFLGSADWMQRNLEYRVEVVVPVEDPALRREIENILKVQLADNAKAWDMASDGSYVQRQPAPGERRRASQEILLDQARARALHV